MPSIQFIPDNKEVEIEDDESVLDAALRAQIPLTHVCGGNARCTTCRILILDDSEACARPRTDQERQLAEQLGFAPMIRLACQTYVRNDVRVRRLVLDDSDIHLTSFPGERDYDLKTGVEKYAAILFADIRNFTAFADKQLPYDVIHMLNRYFHIMREIIERHNGDLNNYMGDGLLALFGLTSPSSAAADAVRAGLEMLVAMQDLQPYLKDSYGHELRMGIGIHYGDVVIGSIKNSEGSRNMVIGDAVNVASRIESCNKDAGTCLLVSGMIYDQVKDMVTTGRVASYPIRGKQEAMQLYEILALAGQD